MDTILMNSAMMPSDQCIYIPFKIERKQFVEALRLAFYEGRLRTYIGYQQTADHIRKISGIAISVSREETQVKPGDRILVCKLKYRVQDVRDKRAGVLGMSDDDYEYWLVETRQKDSSLYS
jgi:hypothetical protein